MEHDTSSIALELSAIADTEWVLNNDSDGEDYRSYVLVIENTVVFILETGRITGERLDTAEDAVKVATEHVALNLGAGNGWRIEEGPHVEPWDREDVEAKMRQVQDAEAAQYMASVESTIPPQVRDMLKKAAKQVAEQVAATLPPGHPINQSRRAYEAEVRSGQRSPWESTEDTAPVSGGPIGFYL